MSLWKKSSGGILFADGGILACEDCPCDESPYDPAFCSQCIGSIGPGAYLLTKAGGNNASSCFAAAIGSHVCLPDPMGNPCYWYKVIPECDAGGPGALGGIGILLGSAAGSFLGRARTNQIHLTTLNVGTRWIYNVEGEDPIDCFVSGLDLPLEDDGDNFGGTLTASAL